MLRGLPGLEVLALTTNGILLPSLAQSLRDAGLRRLNISLDTLSEEKFRQITRRRGLHRVLDGIEAARRAGFQKIRLNAISIKDVSEPEVIDLVEFALTRDMELRFIEFMPLDADAEWEHERVLSGATVRELIEAHFGPMIPAEGVDPSQPAMDYQFVERSGRVGFINSVTEPFCGGCDRLRLTADGKVRNCLFSLVEWDARAVLRGGGSDDALRDLIRECVWAKKPGHGLDSPEFLRPARAMYQIGG
jgi:cyclic pyranopterin phosphate synthase